MSISSISNMNITDIIASQTISDQTTEQDIMDQILAGQQVSDQSNAQFNDQAASNPNQVQNPQF